MPQHSLHAAFEQSRFKVVHMLQTCASDWYDREGRGEYNDVLTPAGISVLYLFRAKPCLTLAQDWLWKSHPRSIEGQG